MCEIVLEQTSAANAAESCCVSHTLREGGHGHARHTFAVLKHARKRKLKDLTLPAHETTVSTYKGLFATCQKTGGTANVKYVYVQIPLEHGDHFV